MAKTRLYSIFYTVIADDLTTPIITFNQRFSQNFYPVVKIGKMNNKVVQVMHWSILDLDFWPVYENWPSYRQGAKSAQWSIVCT